MLIGGSELTGRAWDICVVGTGPVGMALALELDRLGCEVLMIESGGVAIDPSMQQASHATIVDSRRHAPMELAVCRALGGTSWTWGGRSVPYDDVDWMDREFVPEGHWPLTHREIRPWYKRAAEILLCGDDTFEIPFRRPLTHGLTLDFVERWASESKVVLAHREKLIKSEQVKISLKTTLTALIFSQNGRRVEGVRVHTDDGPLEVKATQTVLAMGGVETTRFLLGVQRSRPELFGGAAGALGRFYMGHLSGKIASIVFNDPKSSADLDFKLDESGFYYRRRFLLDSDTQIRHRVLNTAFWPDNPPFYDPGHRSGVLSGVFLALAFPPTGRRLLSEPIRLAHTGPRPYQLGAHLKNAILGAPAGALDTWRILRDRFLRRPRKPGFLVPNRGGKYALHYHAEQVPQAESRITIGADTDAFGTPRAVIDLRFCDQDVESVITSHRLLDEALRANNIGRLDYFHPPEELPGRVYAQAADGFHQVGSTRMGANPATSVVDRNLSAHSLENLYVASSSVFPASGQANSTLLAVAFALRLAHYLLRPRSEAEGEARKSRTNTATTAV